MPTAIKRSVFALPVTLAVSKRPSDGYGSARQPEKAVASLPAPKSGSSIADLLEMAYSRPCFLCERTGPCRHREPAVELAILGI